jgi:hypothetical protein
MAEPKGYLKVVDAVKHVSKSLVQFCGPVIAIVGSYCIAMLYLKCQGIIRQAILQVSTQAWTLYSCDKADLAQDFGL